MNSIYSGVKHNENMKIQDILITNETNPEPFSCQEISNDIADSAVKLSIDPIKVFQKAGSKFSDIIIENYNNLSTSIKHLDTKDLHSLSPLQYPLFTQVKSENSSLLKTSLFIGSSLAFILLIRYKNNNISDKNIETNNNTDTDSIETNSLSDTIESNSLSDNDIIEVTDNCVDNSPLPHKKSIGYFISLFSIW